MRIGDLVEHQHDAFLRQRVDIGRGQGLDLRQEPLMHGVGAEPLVDRVRADDFRGNAGVDILVGQPPGGVFGQEQLSDLPFRVGQGRRNRVPAVKNHRPVRARVPVPAARRTGEFPPFFEGLTAAAAERWFSVAIAHEELVSRGAEYGNLGSSRAILAGSVG